MKNMTRSLICFLVLCSAALAADDTDYAEVLSDFKAAAQTAPFFQQAYGYALFPTIGKGGFGIGGARGKGRVYRAGKYVGDVTLTELSVGFQLGGQAFSELIFFKDQTAFDEFTRGNFEFGAELSAVALSAGAKAEAGTTGSSAGANESLSEGAAAAGGWTGGMAVFTLVKGGLMYQVAVEGQKFRYRPRGADN